MERHSTSQSGNGILCKGKIIIQSLDSARQALGGMALTEKEKQFVQEQSIQALGELILDIAIMCAGGENGTWADIKVLLDDSGIIMPASFYSPFAQLESMLDNVSEGQ